MKVNFRMMKMKMKMGKELSYRISNLRIKKKCLKKTRMIVIAVLNWASKRVLLVPGNQAFKNKRLQWID
jgi:hypothetical protein